MSRNEFLTIVQWATVAAFLMFVSTESKSQAMPPINVDSPCISVSVTSTASAAVALPTSTLNQIRLVSDTTSTGVIFVAVGAAGVVATVLGGTSSRTSNPVLAGEDTVFTRDSNGGLFISAITNSTKTGTLYACVGSGN